MEDNMKYVADLVPATYLRQGCDALRNREKIIRILLQHRKIPETGWDDSTIELLLNRLSMMDSNNFASNCGLGEREGRIASKLVAQRHYNFGHGIGRSGDLTEFQPKAAGSTLLYQLTNLLVADLFKIMGIQSRTHCFVVPTATGMSLVLCMLALKSLRPQAKYVIWSRIDQKSCFKSIVTAGLIPIIINTIKEDDELVTDILSIDDKVAELDPENIVCVMSTTSCFAPRACDDIEAISKICKSWDVPHLINNAYGMQSRYVMSRIQKAERCGRVDLFVQSTDKNLMVPVGGCIIASFDEELLKCVSKAYPGRASSGPIIDVFITLLNLGKDGYMKYVEKREELFTMLLEKLTKFSEMNGEHVLHTPNNGISIAMSLANIELMDITELGSKLFIRNVSGTRVLLGNETKVISNHKFNGWGCHTDNYETPYLTSSAAIGIEQEDIQVFFRRLEKLFRKIKQ